MTKKAVYITAVIILIGLILAGCGGDSPTKSEPVKPSIVFFTAQPRNILVTDSTQLLWRTKSTDSLIILPLQLKVATPDSGRLTIVPDTTREYTAVAYNKNGSQSLTTLVTVDFIPLRVKTVNGDFYKGEMGQSVLDRPLIFKVTDSKGIGLSGKLLHLSRPEGDGTLSIDSGFTDATGKLAVSYSFDGTLGHAVIRARQSNIDSLDIQLRANMLRFGNSGQVQYVLFDDRFADIKHYNGEPNAIDTIGDSTFIVVANYEAALGVSFILYDVDNDGIVDDSAHIYGAVVVDSVFLQPPDSISVNVRYEGKTIDSIGIGSSFYRDVFWTLGAPFPSTGPVDDSLVQFDYSSRNLNFLCDTMPADTAVIQILTTEDFDVSIFPVPPVLNNESLMSAFPTRYYNFRR